MIDIARFLVNHWEIISAAFLAVLSLIIAIIRKRPVTNLQDRLWLEALMSLPALICEAEERFSNGKDKYSWVLKQVSKILEKEGLTDDDVAIITSLLGHQVEAILTAPQKKEK